MYQALYRKWRPLRFADVIGQKHITDTLRSQLKSGRLSHAYLFTGTRGTGKTTCAKILARAVNCEHPEGGDPCNVCPSCRGILEGSVLDVLEIDAASNNGVDNIRDIRDESQYTPATVKKRVYIIDEVHMLSQGAFNALLKTLEEPPAHVLFILATTEIHKVPATILSRCQRFDFRRITPEDIAARLLTVAQEEGIPLTDGGAKMIARLSDGAMRDALSMLDRTAADGTEINQDMVSQSIGILGGEHTAELMDCIREGALARAVGIIGACYVDGRDLAAVLDQLLGLIRDMLLMKTATGDVAAMLSPAYPVNTVQALCEGCAASTLIAYARILQESLARMKNAANRRVEAELCIMRLCALGAQAYDSLGGRVEALEEKLAGQHNAPQADGMLRERLQALENKLSMLTAAGVATPTAPQSDADDDRPPPPGDEDAPPLAPEDIPAKPKQKPARKSPEKLAEWAQWAQLLSNLTGKIGNAAHVNLKLSARGMMQDGTLYIYADDAVTAMLASVPATRDCIAQEAAALLGAPCVVKVREAEQTQSETGEIDAALDIARKNGIEVTEF